MNMNYSQPDPNSGETNHYYSSYDEYRFRAPEAIPEQGGPSQRTGRKGLKVFLAIAAAAVLITALATVCWSFANGRSMRDLLKLVTGSPSGQAGPSEEGTVVLGRPSEEADAGSTDGTEKEEAEQSGSAAVPEIVEKVMPSMVSIMKTGLPVSAEDEAEGSQTSITAGSGIIIGKSDLNILIATNHHLVKDGSDIRVIFADNAQAYGSVRGYDSDTDLAVIEVRLDALSADTRDAIEVIAFGDSGQLRVGEPVIAIGNALGFGQSVSKGIVSVLDCTMQDSDGRTHTLIQTDASINPGNSGGALINMSGELVGINEAKYVSTKVEGVGYAIPMSVAEGVLKELCSGAEREKVGEDRASYLGITCVTVPEEYVNGGYPAGVYVMEVEENGPADQAGILAGDIVTALNGRAVATQEELVEELTYHPCGETTDITVYRLNSEGTQFESLEIPVVLGDRKQMTITAPSESGEAGDAQADPDSADAEGSAEESPKQEPADEEPSDEEPSDEEPSDEEPADEEPSDEENSGEENSDEENAGQENSGEENAGPAGPETDGNGSGNPGIPGAKYSHRGQ